MNVKLYPKKAGASALASTWKISFTDRLKESGLSLADGDALQLELLSNSEVREIVYTKDVRAAIMIPYFDPLTREPLGELPFFRLRYLGSTPPPPSMFGEVATAQKERRYTQSPGAGPFAYFPLLEGTDWPAIIEDAEVPLILTEGEFKAACATKFGYPTIGLGGVHNFMSRRRAVNLLPELESILWTGRTVFIVYDSDSATNPMVKHALLWLGSLLCRRGAQIFEATMPPSADGKKQGIDDLLVSEGARALDEVLSNASEAMLAHFNVLWELNEEYVHVHNLNRFYCTTTEHFHKRESFDTLCLQVPYSEPSVEMKKDGKSETKWKHVPASLAWLKWPMHHQVGRVDYLPQPADLEFERLVPHDSGKPNLAVWNLWPGWGVAPKFGDVSLFTQLIDHLFSNLDAKFKKWFIQWLAYPLQRPGAKLYTAIVLLGPQGVGKSLVGETLGKVYGENFNTIGNAQLEDIKFTKWMEYKQFVLGDEITGSDKYNLADRIKDLITNERTRIELKGVDPTWAATCINYLFTTNRPDAFKLDDDDRRMFIHEIEARPLPQSFYTAFREWKNTNGPAALFYHLLNVDLEGFEPHAAAPVTQAKVEMIEISKTPLELWLRDLMANPSKILAIDHVKNTRDIFTHAELRELYNATLTNGRPVGNISAHLKRNGFRQVNTGGTVRSGERCERYWAVRNCEHWLAATHDELSAHLKGTAFAPVEKVTPIAKKQKKY